MKRKLKGIALASLSLVVLVGCSASSSKEAETKATDIYKDATKINYSNILDDKESHTLYYYYQEDCAHCIELKPTMDAFYDNIEGSDINLEIVDMKDTSNLDAWYDWDSLHETYGETAQPTEDPNYKTNPEDMKTIEDIKIIGTPTLVEVDQGQVENYLVGNDEIETRLSEIEENL